MHRGTHSILVGLGFTLTACDPAAAPTTPPPVSAPHLGANVAAAPQFIIIDLGEFHPFPNDGNGINDGGDIATGFRASATRDLGALVPSGTSIFKGLGTLGGAYSRAMAINASQRIVGMSLTGAGDVHAFLWTREAGMIDIAPLPGRSSVAYDINDGGGVVGAIDVDPGRASHPFYWTQRNGLVDLGTLGGETLLNWATGINNGGDIVGASSLADSRTHAFLWTRTRGMIDLTPRIMFSRAWDINNKGDIVGELATSPNGTFFAFINKAKGEPKVIGVLPGQCCSRARAINDQGNVVGESGPDAFMWSQATGLVVLPRLPGGSGASAYDINNRNQIVGVANSPTGGSHTVIWKIKNNH